MQKKRRWLHKLYLMLATAYASWILQLIVMRFIPEDNRLAFYVLDCLMQPGGALCAPLYLCIAVTFVTGRETPPRWFRLLFVVPVLTILIAWTNPLHHLYYQNFSVVRSEIVFGPYIIVSGLFSYIFLLGAIVYMVVFGLRNKSALYWKQFAMLAISGLCPLAVSMLRDFPQLSPYMLYNFLHAFHFGYLTKILLCVLWLEFPFELQLQHYIC